MNDTKAFRSVFKEHLTAFYHDHRATRGTSVSLLEHLHIFDTYLFRIGFCKQYFKEEDYEAWIKTMPHNKPITVNRKTMAIRKFLFPFSALGHPRHPEGGYLHHPGTTRRHSSLCSSSMPR